MIRMYTGDHVREMSVPCRIGQISQSLDEWSLCVLCSRAYIETHSKCALIRGVHYSEV